MHEFEKTPGDSEGQGSLECCSPWGHKELDTTERLDNNILMSWTLTTFTTCMRVCAKSLPSCPTLCDPVDCSPPGSSVHRIPQARILEWDAVASSGGVFPTQGWKLRLLCLLHWQAGSLPRVLPKITISTEQVWEKRNDFPQNPKYMIHTHSVLSISHPQKMIF